MSEIETRYVKPYFSTIQLILNSNPDNGIPTEAPKIKTTITGWLNNQVVKTDEFSFLNEPVDTPSMTDVLELAKTLGIDVVESWNEAFNEIANEFDQTKDQAVGAQSNGPSITLRPDSFFAHLHPTDKKSIAIKVGIYSPLKEKNSNNEVVVVNPYHKYQNSINLVFEDGQSKRERDNMIAGLVGQNTDATNRITLINSLITLKQNNEPLPENTSIEFIDKTIPQLQGLVALAESDIAFRQSRISVLQSVIAGDISKLLGSENTTLQTKVLTSVAALCTAILITLKSYHPDYVNIDVAKIMSEFAVPDIS